MPSPFPGMDPFLERNPLFHELHTQFLAAAQALLQPKLRPRYAARLEDQSTGLCKQRRITIYARPRLAVASVELLSPSNKAAGSTDQARYLEKRSSALHGGLHWVEIDLLRGGQRMPVPVTIPEGKTYSAYIAQATPTGWNHLLSAWELQAPLPLLPIPLLGGDQVALDLGECFRRAYDAIAADEEAEYGEAPPPPKLAPEQSEWADGLLRQHGLRPPGAAS